MIYSWIHKIYLPVRVKIISMTLDPRTSEGALIDISDDGRYQATRHEA